MSPLLLVCALAPLALLAVVLLEALLTGHRASIAALAASAAILFGTVLLQRVDPDSEDAPVRFAAQRIDSPARFARDARPARDETGRL